MVLRFAARRKLAVEVVRPLVAAAERPVGTQRLPVELAVAVELEVEPTLGELSVEPQAVPVRALLAFELVQQVALVPGSELLKGLEAGPTVAG